MVEVDEALGYDVGMGSIDPLGDIRVQGLGEGAGVVDQGLDGAGFVGFEGFPQFSDVMESSLSSMSQRSA